MQVEEKNRQLNEDAETIEEKNELQTGKKKHRKKMCIRDRPITVRTEHLDSNHHVNNTQYVLMASRYLPSDFSLHQVRAEYRYQALLGDTMIPVVTKEEMCIRDSLCTALIRRAMST